MYSIDNNIKGYLVRNATAIQPINPYAFIKTYQVDGRYKLHVEHALDLLPLARCCTRRSLT